MRIGYALCNLSCWLYFWSCQLCLVSQICSWTRTFHVVCDYPPAKNTSGREGSKKGLFADMVPSLPSLTKPFLTFASIYSYIFHNQWNSQLSRQRWSCFDTADAILWLYHPIIWSDDNLESAQASNTGSCFSQIWPCRSCEGAYRGSLCHVNVWAVVPKFQANVDQLNAWQHFPALELYNYKRNYT